LKLSLRSSSHGDDTGIEARNSYIEVRTYQFPSIELRVSELHQRKTMNESNEVRNDKNSAIFTVCRFQKYRERD
jgi:hypothetical protein